MFAIILRNVACAINETGVTHILETVDACCDLLSHESSYRPVHLLTVKSLQNELTEDICYLTTMTCASRLDLNLLRNLD
jgi:hypothetical protein